MLTCVIDAIENREVAIANIPNAFVQTVVEDEKDRAFILLDSGKCEDCLQRS